MQYYKKADPTALWDEAHQKTSSRPSIHKRSGQHILQNSSQPCLAIPNFHSTKSSAIHEVTAKYSLLLLTVRFKLIPSGRLLFELELNYFHKPSRCSFPWEFPSFQNWINIHTKPGRGSSAIKHAFWYANVALKHETQRNTHSLCERNGRKI